MPYAPARLLDGFDEELVRPGERCGHRGLENSTEGGEAFALLDGTLVRLQYTQVADRDVLAYFDALRPVARDDLDFKR